MRNVLIAACETLVFTAFLYGASFLYCIVP